MKKPIQVQVTRREWRERTFRLSGRVQATIQYVVAETGLELVIVNGRPVLDTTGDALALEKRRCMRFSIPGFAGFPGTGVPVMLDIRNGCIFGSVALRLMVAGEIVHEDRAFARLDRELRVRRLPLSAFAPPKDITSLPLPGDGPRGSAKTIA